MQSTIELKARVTHDMLTLGRYLIAQAEADEYLEGDALDEARYTIEQDAQSIVDQLMHLYSEFEEQG
jgi:hypothetical protein